MGSNNTKVERVIIYINKGGLLYKKLYRQIIITYKSKYLFKANFQL